ncbi:MAG TPA: DUF4214 domain-containing protein [Gemmataceae bacterium]|nr:DUF4214 domain-containing protein [Gemmataceae bacterium]
MRSDPIHSLGTIGCGFLKRFVEYFRSSDHAVPPPPSGKRLQLESLEDRLVPSLMEGTLLVGTGPSSFSSQDQSSFTPGIIAVDPNTGSQIRLSMGQLLALPTYIAQAPNQQIYVTDLKAFGTGAVFRIDPNTGQQIVVAKGGLLDGPNVLVFLNGYLYVADEGDASSRVHNIVQIDPNTGQQRLITDGSKGGFTVPVGMAPAPGDNLYVADEPGNVQGADPGAIWEVNLDTGQQTLISRGGLFNHPVDVAVDANGNLIVGNTGSASDNYTGSIVQVNPQTGVQTRLASLGPDTGLDSVEVGDGGTIYVGAISNGTTPGQLFAVDPSTGNWRIVSSGRNLSLTEGIRTFHITATGASVNPQNSAGTPNQRFVEQVYFDLLRRSVDPTGLAAWSALLDKGTSRTQVVAAIQNSSEYHALVVGDMYQLVLQRAADPSGLATWVNFLNAGGTAEQLEAVLLGSGEFFASHGGTTQEFLAAVYQVVLQRPIDPSGAQSWGQALQSNALSRQAVAAGLLASAESNRLEVQSMYTQFLHRQADPGGLDTFTAALERGLSDEQLALLLLSSAEYFAGV